MQKDYSKGIWKRVDPPFGYVGSPQKVWIKGFSPQPSWWKVIGYTLLVAVILVLFGQLLNRALYMNSQAQCLTYKYPTQADKDRCANYGVIFKPLK